jgi:hypothetical protein
MATAIIQGVAAGGDGPLPGTAAGSGRDGVALVGVVSPSDVVALPVLAELEERV